MRRIPAIAIAVGIADAVFGAALVLAAAARPGTANYPEYSRWLGIFHMTLAALLFMLATDPERFFPVAYVVAAAHAATAAFAVLSPIDQFWVLLIDGGLGAGLVVTILHDLAFKRADELAAGERAEEAKPAEEQKPAKDAKPSREAKPAEEEKPSEEATPAEDAKPGDKPDKPDKPDAGKA